MSEQGRQYQAMAKTASWTLVSRVLGLVRDQVTTFVFGANAVGAAFLFAFQIPNLFRRLLGEGALTAAIVPVLADKQARDGKAVSFGFLNYVVRRVFPWTLGLTLVGIGLALLWSVLASDAKQQMAAELTAYCMPYMPLICIAALFTSAVNLSGRFGLAEFASAMLNLCMIIGLGLFGINFTEPNDMMAKARWLCAGALAGGALQLLIPLWGLKQEGWNSRLMNKDVTAWQVLRVAFIPAALGAGIQQINFLVSRSLAFNVDGAGLTYYYIANRIVELPIGLFSASIATVMFPALATAFAERDELALSRNFARGMRLILAVNIGAAVGLAVLSEPVIRLLFEMGRFTAADCTKTRNVLVLFALAMPFYAMISLVTRALNVVGNTQATFRAAVQAAVINIIGSILAIACGYGIEGLAVANAVSTVWQYAVLRKMLAKSAPAFLTESLRRPCAQVLTGSLLMGFLAYHSYHWIIALRLATQLNGKLALFLAMLMSAILSATIYAIFLDWLKYPERDMIRTFVNKLIRPAGYQFKV